MSCWISPTRVPQKNGWICKDDAPNLQEVHHLGHGPVHGSGEKMSPNHRLFLGKNLHNNAFFWLFLGIQQQNKPKQNKTKQNKTTTATTTKKHTHVQIHQLKRRFPQKKWFHTEGIAPTFQLSGLDQRQKNGTKKSSS